VDRFFLWLLLHLYKHVCPFVYEEFKVVCRGSLSTPALRAELDGYEIGQLIQAFSSRIELESLVYNLHELPSFGFIALPFCRLQMGVDFTFQGASYLSVLAHF
jgi:hypothetical protein